MCVIASTSRRGRSQSNVGIANMICVCDLIQKLWLSGALRLHECFTVFYLFPCNILSNNRFASCTRTQAAVATAVTQAANSCFSCLSPEHPTVVYVTLDSMMCSRFSHPHCMSPVICECTYSNFRRGLGQSDFRLANSLPVQSLSKTVAVRCPRA